MRNQWMIRATAISLALFTGRLLAEDMEEKHPKDALAEQSMKCEVVDMACYVAKGAKGEAHQACAAKCIGEGGMLALLNNGKLYIHVTKDFRSARNQFVTKGGETVKVLGSAQSKDGLNYIIVGDARKK
jgi:hypothetical protein